MDLGFLRGIGVFPHNHLKLFDKVVPKGCLSSGYFSGVTAPIIYGDGRHIYINLHSRRDSFMEIYGKLGYVVGAV